MLMKTNYSTVHGTSPTHSPLHPTGNCDSPHYTTVLPPIHHSPSPSATATDRPLHPPKPYASVPDQRRARAHRHLSPAQGWYRTNNPDGAPGDLLPWTVEQKWRGWLACQPRDSIQLLKWPDPVSWVYWHVEWWRKWLEEQPQDSHWCQWNAEQCAYWECSMKQDFLPKSCIPSKNWAVGSRS